MHLRQRITVGLCAFYGALAVTLSPISKADDFRCINLAALSKDEAGIKIDALHSELGLINDNNAKAQRAFIEPVCRRSPLH